LINATPTSQQLRQWRIALDAEGSRSEYVTSVVSRLLLEDDVLRYYPSVTLAKSGTYPLVMSIDKAGDILAQFPIL